MTRHTLLSPSRACYRLASKLYHVPRHRSEDHDNAKAEECARAIPGWKPLPVFRRPARLRPSKRQ